MSNTLLNGDDFGLKIYNRFPPVYREVDEHNNFALKRYLQSISDGGFKYTIEELNGILDLVDKDMVSIEVLPLLYNQYGLEVFNGIPEKYLRYFLPFLGLAYSKKGSLGVIPFVATSLSGIKTTTEVSSDAYDNPILRVILEMDSTVVENNYFPNPEQFGRILLNFLPFYVTCFLVYLYEYDDYTSIRCLENFSDSVSTSAEESSELNLAEEVSNKLILQRVDDTISFIDNEQDMESFLILNNESTLLNNSNTINLDVVDRIYNLDATETVGIPTKNGYIILNV